MMILGIDPAKDGAAVLLNERGEVTDVWSWRYMKRKQSVYKTLHTYIDSQGHQILHRTTELRDGGTIAKQIGIELSHLQSVQVAIEDAYVNTSHKKTDKLFKSKMNASVQSGLRVARFSGEMIGGLSCHLGYAMSDVSYIMASKWRHQVLRLNPFTKRDVCKEQSLRMIPLLCPTIKPHLEIHGQLDHVTDACGVALWRKQQ